MVQLAALGGLPVRQDVWPSWPTYDAGTETALLNVLRSARWALSSPFNGAECKERTFSRAFAEFVGVDFCTPVTSGTAALTVGLLALGVGYGDEVIVPGLTWVACASAVVSIGAKPIFVDLSLESLCIDPSKINQAITSRTKAILVVHAFCRTADMHAIKTIAAQFDIPIVEDCSQAHGADIAGRMVGTFGDLAVFSFQHSKVLTSGEGGAIVTNDPKLYDRAEQLRADGRSFSGKRKLHHLELIERSELLGQNHCLSEFQSAILIDRLEHLQQENSRRRRNAKILDGILETIEGFAPLVDQKDCRLTYYNYIIRVDTGLWKIDGVKALSLALSAELNVQISPIYAPLYRHPLYVPKSTARLPAEERERLAKEAQAVRLEICEWAHGTHIAIPHPPLLASASEIGAFGDALEKVTKNINQLREIDVNDNKLSF